MAIFQKEKLIIFFITLIVLLTATSAYAAYEDYFSFERFDRDYDVSILLPVLKRTGINPDRIVKSLDAFSSSLQFIKEDDQSQAGQP